MTNKQLTISNEDFIKQFEALTLAPEYFDHLGHVRISCLYLARDPFAKALNNICGGIKRYAEHLGASDKYHATISYALVHIIAAKFATLAAADWQLFCQQCPELLTNAMTLLEQYYSESVLVSEQASLSRSSLLYYHRIGLLVPSGRTSSNYRLYTSNDSERLAQACQYRQLGLSLAKIKLLLTEQQAPTKAILQQRLQHLNKEISGLRVQQQLILRLLGDNELNSQVKTMNKAQWVAILRAAGLDETAMQQWHIAFERDLPQMHQDFLQSLGISASEIANIRAWSKQSD